MKKNVLFILGVLIAPFVFAQPNYVLFEQNLNLSHQSYYDFYATDSTALYIENTNIQPAEGMSQAGAIRLTKSKPENKKVYFFQDHLNDFYYNTYVNNEEKVLVKEDLSFDWKLRNEFKKILGYTCQKATTTFRGRNYTAWFTKDLPYAYGPWKLHGLDGLILEMFDEDRIIWIQAKEIAEREFDENTFLAAEDFSQAVSIEHYLELVEKKNKEILEKIRRINPNFEIDRNCDTCNKSLEIF